MKNITEWLIELEHLANDFYQRAADFFIDNKPLHNFLMHTAKDEAWHYHVMGSAANYFQKHYSSISPVIPDDETKHKIESVFRKNIELISNKTITEEQLIDCMVATEFSEWNDFFLYVVNTLKKVEHEFEYVASEIQHHLKHTEHFIIKESGWPEKIEELKGLTPIHKEKILVVEDNEVFAGLLEAILSKEGTVHLAVNGQEALKKLEKHFYKLIVSDIDMPIMDGITFYKEATSKFPNLKNIFVYLSGDLSPNRVSFLTDNKLKHLAKPATVKDIRQAIAEVMYQVNHED